MSEVPYEPDYAHMISTALVAEDYEMARFLLASGSFGDSLNHAYRTDMERTARQFLYGFDRSNELNIKAHLLKGYAEDSGRSFVSKLEANGLFPAYVEEAWKNHEAAREALNDLLQASKRQRLPREVVVDADANRLKQYLEDCLSFERFGPRQRKRSDLMEINVQGPFYARALTINYRRILFDIIAVYPLNKRCHQTPRRDHNRTRRHTRPQR